MIKYIDQVLDKSLAFAKANKFKSYDVSDLRRTPFHASARYIPDGFIKKLWLAPITKIGYHYPNLTNKLIGGKMHKYPQGQAMLIRALVALAKANHPLGDIDLAIKESNWLLENRSIQSNYISWGQPFRWYSRSKVFPPNLPRATVSSQVAWAMLDLFDYTQDQKYLDIAREVCYLFINEFNYQPDDNENICISYTPIDNYHIHNANLLAASVMMRTGRILGLDNVREFAIRAANFSTGHQNEDGSFYYWAPPDKLYFKIDNYHTGFVLESYKTIKEDCGSNLYDEAYQKGLEYYYHNLFDGPIPKMTNKRTYPIDIQSCAQSIINFSLESHQKIYLQKAQSIANYTINNFFIPEQDHFAYQIYANGQINKAYYFRWGDAWMIRALSNLLLTVKRSE